MLYFAGGRNKDTWLYLKRHAAGTKCRCERAGHDRGTDSDRQRNYRGGSRNKSQRGDKVKPGDLLVVLKSDELLAQVKQAELALTDLAKVKRPQAEAELASAKAQLDQASREAARRRAAGVGILSAEEIEQAVETERVARNNFETARLKAEALASGQVEEASLRQQLAVAQAQLAKAKIRSTVAGTVLTRDVEPGDLVQPGQTLFTVALNGNTEIRVPLDERNLPQLALEQTATVIADAYPDQSFPARISFIAPSIDPQRGQ